MRTPWALLTILIVLLAFGTTSADAQVSAPQLVKMQGYLTNQSGTPQTGTFTMTFTLYDSQFPGGTSVATVGPLSVPVSSGLYDVDLSLPSSAFTGSPTRYLEVTVNGEVQTPRIQMASAPFCYQADKLDGFEGSELVKKAGDTMTGNLTVSGTVYSTTGGFKFPDGSVQTTAAAGGGGGTLDQAYNSGGAGAGRTINANSGAVNIAGSSGLTVNGNVGIGTTSPTTSLDVNKASGQAVVKLRSGSNAGALIQLQRYNAGGSLFNVEAGANSVDNFSIHRGAPYNDFVISNAGKVGIGTATPDALLTLYSPGTDDLTFKLQDRRTSTTGDFLNKQGFYDYDLAGEAAYIGLRHNMYFGPGVRNLVFGLSGSEKMRVTNTGNVGIGTTNPDARLHLMNPTGFNLPGLHIEQPASFDFARVRLNVTGSPYWDMGVGSGPTAPLIFYHGGDQGQVPHAMEIATDGTVSVKVLQINGADLAEPFALSAETSAVKGSVVVIDEENPGKVRLSDRAYDKRVAGILSGANGVRSGIALKQEGFNDHGENVALSGRVYALADASNGAIAPGDLLTTSDNPGRCMKATDHSRAQGAVIGKAMSSLENGQGMVLVLVSLQ
jgi:hypothetical protein